MGLCDAIMPNDSSVDWAERDVDLSRRVANAVLALSKAAGGPLRVTQRAVFRLLERSDNLYNNRDKLLETIRAISAAVQSPEEFAHRLLRQIVTEHTSSRAPLVRSRLASALGYGRLKRFPSLRIELDSLLSDKVSLSEITA
jgi:hypothetical protein